MADPKLNEIAQWMLDELNRNGELAQDFATDGIQRGFGAEYTYINEDGGVSISRKVLRAFRQLTGDTVVWERSDLLWRKRQPYDTPGSRVAD